MAKELKELTPRHVDYSQWYQDLVIKADLAESAAVRGCMVSVCKGQKYADLGRSSVTRVLPCFDVGNDGEEIGN